MNFVEAAHPIRLRGNGSVGGRIEVAMESFFRRIDDNRVAAVALDVRMVPRVDLVAQDEFGSKLVCARKERAGHIFRLVVLHPAEMERARIIPSGFG